MDEKKTAPTINEGGIAFSGIYGFRRYEEVKLIMEGIVMCGRFTLTIEVDELLKRYGIEQIAFDFQPRYNIAPGQTILAVIHDGKKNRIGELKWGLIPSWAKDEKIGYQTINAKAETLMEKASFKVPFQRKRCIIPADGFYEWKKSGNTKLPMRIVMKDRDIFSLTGLYDTWTAPDGRKVSSCTIITTTPNELMREIHDRMPVILRLEDEAVWLDRERHVDELRALLEPYPEEKMYAYPVNPMAGNVKNDRPECIMELRS